MQDKQTLLFLGAIGAALIFILSFAQWRLAIKLSLIAALLEGAIRKWVLPQGEELVYFLKDFLLLGAYARFFLYPDQRTRMVKVQGPVLLVGVTAAIVSLSALNPNLNSFLAALLGIKIYLLYIPLAFIMPHLFEGEKDLARQCSWFVLLAIPICALGFLQFRSPQYSVLNVYAHDTEALAGGVAVFGDNAYVRVTGTFSYISGMIVFLIVFTGLAMALLCSPHSRFRPIIMFVVLPMLAANGIMSGSRGALIGQGIIVAAFVLAAPMIGISKQASRAQNAIFAVMVIAFAVHYFFRDAKQAYAERAFAKGTKEEMGKRILWPIESIFVAFHDGGLGGMGIGITHPASYGLRRTLHLAPPLKDPPVYEAETGQVALELGLAGFLAWYIMRFYLFWLAWRTFLRIPPGTLKAMMVLLLIFNVIELHGQFVFNHTAQFYFWALYGLALMPYTRNLTYRRKTAAPVQQEYRGSRPQLPAPSAKS